MSSSSGYCGPKFSSDPETGLEDEDEMLRKMEEETNLAIMHISGAADGHSTSKPPVELAVDIEVEKCSDEEYHEDTSSKDVPEEPVPVKKRRRGYNKKREKSCAVQSAYIDRDKLFQELDNIIETSENETDIALAIHTRNIWGKIFTTPNVMSELDIGLQAVINSLTDKGVIVSYKCYICIQAWWFLNPFREHLKNHSNVKIKAEKVFWINIVAFDDSWSGKYQFIYIPGDCYKCDKDFYKHVYSRKKYLKCYSGEEKTEEGVTKNRCNICNNVIDSRDHYTTCHMVRSDVPIDTRVRICKQCDDTYYVFPLHECKKKRYTTSCYSCQKPFMFAVAFENHMKLFQKDCECPQCGLILEKECMLPKHLLEHSVNFLSVEFCPVCKGNMVFFSTSSIAEHMLKVHKLVRGKKNPFLTIIPRSSYELAYSEACAAKIEKEKFIEPIEDFSAELFTVKEEYIEDIDIEENGSGYELLLSKVFNTSKSSVSGIKKELMTTSIKVENTDVKTDKDIDKLVAAESTAEDDVQDDLPNISLDSDDSSDQLTYMEILINQEKFAAMNSSNKKSKIINKKGNAPGLKQGTKLVSAVVSGEKCKEVKEQVTTESKANTNVESEVMKTNSKEITQLNSKTNLKDKTAYNEISTIDSQDIENEIECTILNKCPEMNRNKQIHNILEEVAVEFEKGVNESDDDDVQIIDVENEVYEIDDDDVDLETEDSDSVESNQDMEVEESPAKAMEEIPSNKLNEDVVKNVENQEPVNDTLTEIEIVKVKSERDEPQKESNKEVKVPCKTASPKKVIDVKNIMKYLKKVKDDVQIKNFQYIAASNSAIFQISLPDQDSESDDQLHIALSDDDSNTKFDDSKMAEDIITFTALKCDKTDIADNLALHRQRIPKTYKCKCGFTGRHREFRAHITFCTVTKRISTTGNVKTYNCECGYSGKFREFKMHVGVCKVSKKQHPKSMKYRKGYERMKRLIVNLKEYACSKCDVLFGTINEYLLHLSNHGYGENVCPICRVDTVSGTNFVNHMMKYHITQNFYKVWYIVKGSSGRSVLGFNCKMCKQQVHHKQAFIHWEKHLELNDEDERIKKESLLEIIENTTMEKSLLRQIIDIMSPDYVMSRELWSRGCIACSHSVGRKSDYKRHLVEHLLKDAQRNRHRYQMLRCQICSQDLVTDRMFRDHMREHACLAMYKCQPCNIAFSNSSNFSKHKKMHSPNLMTCDICQKKFHKKSTIEKHIITEHNEKVVRTCPHCDAVFSDGQSYRTHMRSEHKTTGYKCHYCDKRYRMMKDLNEHMWKEHRSRKLCADCFVCGRQFLKYSDVKVHMRKEHSVVVTREMFNGKGSRKLQKKCED